MVVVPSEGLSAGCAGDKKAGTRNVPAGGYRLSEAKTGSGR